MSMLRVVNPATGTVVRDLPCDTPASVDGKVAAAREALPAWRERSLGERVAIIRRFRDMLVERADQLALVLTTETGKPISQARGEIRATPGRLDFFLENVETVIAPKLMRREPMGSGVPGTGALEETVTYEPLGVVANISAWNYPYFVGSNVFAPALLAGNAVVYKPSEHATLTGLAIAGLLHEAGVPEAIFTTAVGRGDVGAALIDAGVDGVFFTGSYSTGVKVATSAAHHLIPTQLELGGKDPVYVADDVDPAAVASALADGAFYNNGQSCCAVERIYVHRSVFMAFRTAFVEAINGFSMGDPAKTDTYLGPLTREEQLAVLQAQVDDAVSKGATVLAGGRRADREGWYFEPTILSNVTHDMKVMREETFGPVIGIQEVSDDQEAAKLMADTPYGLTAGVYSADRARAAAVLAQLPTGSSYWNCCDRVSPVLPWTGRGHSGLGSTLSHEGIRAFVTPRAWHMRAP